MGTEASKIFSVAEARRLARRRLPRAVFDYVDGAAEDEITMRANRAAFESVTFRPRMAVSVGKPDLATTVVGQPVSMPVLLAPCGFLRTAHPHAEPGAARAAANAGTVFALSTVSGTTIEDVAVEAPGPLWFQLYFLGGRAGAEILVDRAQRARYSALIVTVDTAVPGNRERDVRNGAAEGLRRDLRSAVKFGAQVLTKPRWLTGFVRDGMPLSLANAATLGPNGGPIPAAEVMAALSAEPPTWADLGWIREQWSGPVLVKGVLTGEDARRAVDAGADAVIVSNHGGRQLDGAPATLRVLPEIVAAVGSDTEVLLDGGVQRGADVLKALALGARSVLIGRAFIYGLAAAGEPGVSRVLEVLRADLRRTLRLLGCASAHELDRSWIDAPADWDRAPS